MCVCLCVCVCVCMCVYNPDIRDIFSGPKLEPVLMYIR